MYQRMYYDNALVTDSGIELITTASCGKALGGSSLGFRIVTVFPDRIEHKFYGFDDIPFEKFGLNPLYYRKRAGSGLKSVNPSE